jgi:hypothetical protein
MHGIAYLGGVMKIRSAIVLLGLVSTSAIAHHGRVEFRDPQVSELQGEIVSLDWRHPHPAFSISTVEESGNETVWLIESFGGVGSLGGAEAVAEMFEIGSRVTVAGRQSNRRANYFLGTHVLLEDGREAILGANFEPRWSEDTVGGRNDQNLVREVVDAATENRGIFRIWSMSERNAGMSRDWSFTDEAVAARVDWDPIDNPLYRCEQPGMPAVTFQPVPPVQFIDAGDTIEFRGAWFGTVRTIHMGDAAAAETQSPSPLGYSVGHWEGNTFIVETTRIDWPYFDTQGTPQSQDMRVIERYTLSDDQTRLDQHVTYIDPITFTEPATYQKYFMALGDRDMTWRCRILG